MDIVQLLELTERAGASDLHLKAGASPFVRISGELKTVDDGAPLDQADIEAAFERLTTPEQRRRFEDELELDMSYQLTGRSRFRVNASQQRGTIALAFRRIPLDVPSLASLGLPDVCHELASERQGLILVTGPTGSGKTTTLAAFIDHINQQRAFRIVTIEDPIEFVYEDKQSLITQREIGLDTYGFATATRQALRQDPDVLLVGEMRDRETMAACLTAAETGHLVLSTLHTNNGPQTVDRIVDMFPEHRQGQIRMQLSLVLVAVFSQSLLPRLDGSGRIPAVEVMLATSAIRNLIREGKTHQMENVIQTGREEGMQTMDQALETLYRTGGISLQTALDFAQDAANLRTALASA